jgi:hypothetical protein
MLIYDDIQFVPPLSVSWANSDLHSRRLIIFCSDCSQGRGLHFSVLVVWQLLKPALDIQSMTISLRLNQNEFPFSVERVWKAIEGIYMWVSEDGSCTEYLQSNFSLNPF